MHGIHLMIAHNKTNIVQVQNQIIWSQLFLFNVALNISILFATHSLDSTQFYTCFIFSLIRHKNKFAVVVHSIKKFKKSKCIRILVYEITFILLNTTQLSLCFICELRTPTKLFSKKYNRNQIRETKQKQICIGWNRSFQFHTKMKKKCLPCK